MDVEKLVAKIDGDITGLRAALTEAGVLTKRTAGDMGKQWKAVAGPVGVAEKAINGLKLVVGALAVKELYQAARGSLEFSAGLKDVSLQTKVGIEALQEYRYAASQLGVQSNTLDAALTRMTVTIGKARLEGGESAKVFRRLGLDVAQIGEGEQAFDAILDALQQIEDPTQRAAQAFQIFGREAGPKFAQFIDQGAAGINRLRQAARDAGAVISEDVVLGAAEANDKLAALDQVIKAQLTQSLVNLAGPLTAIGQAFATGSRYIKEFGEGLGIVMAKLAGARDFPLEEELEDASNAVKRLENQVAAAQKTIADRGPEGFFGQDRVARLAAFEEQLKTARAELELLKQAQLDALGSGLSPPPPAEVKQAVSVTIPEDILKRQHDLMRAIGDDTARVGMEMAAHTIDNFMTIGDGVRVSFEQALAHQRNYYDTARSLEQSRYEQQLADFNQQADELQLSREDRQFTQQQIESAHEGRLTEIQREGQEARHALEQAGLQQRIDGAKFVLDNLAALTSTKSRKLFEIGKAAAIGHGLVQAYESVIAAYRWGSEIGGPVVGAGFAAAAAAAQFANLAKLKSVQFGGGGTSPSSGGGKGSVPEGGGGEGGGGPSRTIFLSGIDPNKLYDGRVLIDILNQAQGDGAVLKPVT